MYMKDFLIAAALTAFFSIFPMSFAYVALVVAESSIFGG